jgi:hypothetical protein
MALFTKLINLLYMLMLAMLESMKDIVRLALCLC